MSDKLNRCDDLLSLMPIGLNSIMFVSRIVAASVFFFSVIRLSQTYLISNILDYKNKHVMYIDFTLDYASDLLGEKMP